MLISWTWYFYIDVEIVRWVILLTPFCVLLNILTCMLLSFMQVILLIFFKGDGGTHFLGCKQNDFKRNNCNGKSLWYKDLYWFCRTDDNCNLFKLIFFLSMRKLNVCANLDKKIQAETCRGTLLASLCNSI